MLIKNRVVDVKLEKKIRFFVIVTVLIPMLLLLWISMYLTGKNIEKIEQNYLSVSMNYARQLLMSRKHSLQHAGRVLISSDKFRQAIAQQDYADIENLLEQFNQGFSYLDLSMVVDLRNGTFIADKSEAVYKPEKLIGKYVSQTAQYKTAVFSEEVLSLDDLFVPDSNAYNRLLVEFQNDGGREDPYLRKALIGLNTIPVFADNGPQNVVAVLIMVDAINNDLELTKAFGEHMKEAFLAISIDGVRIASNITTEDKGDYIGSRIPISSEVTYSDGAQHFGKQYFKNANEYHIFIDEEINNQFGDAVAMMGLGIPERRFEKMIAAHYIYLFVAIVFFLISMALLGNCFAKRLLRPIVALNAKMTKYGKIAIENFVSPEAGADEIANLNATFMALVKQLGRKEAQRKEYLAKLLQANRQIRNYADELQKTNARLESTVNERTADLQLLVSELKAVDIAKSTFMANMSHELRTPLNVIMGSADILEEGIWGDLTAKQKKYVSSIKDSSSHLLQLINDVLDISKMATGKMLLNIEQFDVASIVKQAVNGLRAMADEKQLNMAVQIMPENFTVNADSNKLLEILYNLLSNAVKFTPERGSIEVTVKKLTNSFKVTIKDSGIGIAAEDQERVFLEFEQVENSYTKKYEGTGLGLPIVKKMVAMMGGQVYLRSMVGIGTEVTFVLPIDVQVFIDGKNVDKSE